MCVCVCKCVLYFTLGLCSPECECPTEHRFQTNRPFTEDEGSFVRQKPWDCSTHYKCVFAACVFQKEIMCVSLRKNVCMSVRKRLCLYMRDLFDTVSGMSVCLWERHWLREGKQNKCLVILSAFQSDINRQGGCIHVKKSVFVSCFCWNEPKWKQQKSTTASYEDPFLMVSKRDSDSFLEIKRDNF